MREADAKMMTLAPVRLTMIAPEREPAKARPQAMTRKFVDGWAPTSKLNRLIRRLLTGCLPLRAVRVKRVAATPKGVKMDLKK